MTHDDTRWYVRVFQAAFHAALFCGMWLLTSGCLLPVLIALGRGRLGWGGGVLLAMLIGLAAVTMAVLADDVPEDSKYDA